MFRRAVVLNQAKQKDGKPNWKDGKPNWKDGKPVLEAYTALTGLLEQPVYSDADKKRILELLEALGLLSFEVKGGVKKAKFSEDNKWVWLRRSRGQLISKHKDGTVEV